MMDKEMLNKLRSEQPLSAEEALRLDSALDEPAFRTAAEAVGLLEDEAPSLAWRSALNQRLASVSRRRRSALVWRFGFAGAAVAAASVLVVSLLHPVRPPEPDGPAIARNAPEEASLEDTILAEHQDALGQASLGVHVSMNGSGL